MNETDFQARCANFTFVDGASDFAMNYAGMDFTGSELESIAARFDLVHKEMVKIELGEIKNPDENRKVTHFTDRSGYTGSTAFAEVEAFAAAIREGKITGSTGKKFESALINGIGGSALGPQLLQMAINGPYWNEKSDEKRSGNLKIYFLDNTDPSGLYDALQVCDLETTLVVNVSKSGGTQETKNNMLVAMQIFADAGLDFARHACAITMSESELDKTARSANFLKVFEMAESIGGRTSETSIVGHLPAALAGIDFASLIRGACHMDNLTRKESFRENPAYILSALWYIAGKGKGERNMVIVPYSDRLILFSRYLQQLVMESLGKEKDLDGNTVHQGLNVFGNKGGTDAHAFIQQLNDGKDDFFITFIEVMEDVMTANVNGTVTMGDYLHGFMTGLAGALRSKGRQTIEMRIPRVDTFSIGMLIALYERAVASYAELIHINAFHQPGVQAYKLASKSVISLLDEVEKALPLLAPFQGSVETLAEKLGMEKDLYILEGIISKLSFNNSRRLLPVSVTRKWDGSSGMYLYDIRKNS